VRYAEILGGICLAADPAIDEHATCNFEVHHTQHAILEFRFAEVPGGGAPAIFLGRFMRDGEGIPRKYVVTAGGGGTISSCNLAMKIEDEVNPRIARSREKNRAGPRVSRFTRNNVRPIRCGRERERE